MAFALASCLAEVQLLLRDSSPDHATSLRASPAAWQPSPPRLLSAPCAAWLPPPAGPCAPTPAPPTAPGSGVCPLLPACARINARGAVLSSSQQSNRMNPISPSSPRCPAAAPCPPPPYPPTPECDPAPGHASAAPISLPLPLLHRTNRGAPPPPAAFASPLPLGLPPAMGCVG